MVHCSIKHMAAHGLQIKSYHLGCDVTGQLFDCGSSTDSGITPMKTGIPPAGFEGVISNPSMSAGSQPLPFTSNHKSKFYLLC